MQDTGSTEYSNKTFLKAWLSKAKNLKNLGILAFVGSLCSIVSFIVGTLKIEHIWILALGYMVFALSLSAITFYEMHRRKEQEVAVLKLRTELDRVRKRIAVYETKSYVFHMVFHCLREADALLMVSEDYSEDRHELFQTNIVACLTHFHNFLTALNDGNDCSLCIKLLLEPPADGSYEVVTFARNAESQWRSQDDDFRYELNKNTAFSEILNSKNRWFYSDDLVEEHRRGHYLNQNPTWQAKHHYKTAAVLPIQAPKISDTGKGYQGIKGFLCLDSPTVQAFPEQPTVNLLACLADNLYTTLTCYRSWSKAVENESGHDDKTD